MNHIFNLSKIKSGMVKRPNAQRLQDFMNRGTNNALTKEQKIELMDFIQVQCDKTIAEIKLSI